jgi:hypothetical protein
MSRAGAPAAVRVAAAAGALVVVGLAGAAPAAIAASGDSVTVDGSGSFTARHSGSLTVDASAPAYCELGLTQRHATLTMSGPSGSGSSTRTLATSGATPCNQDINLDTTVATPSRNGAYTVEFDSHRHSATATVDVAVPPAAPRDLSATTDGSTASFDWTANSEPDVTGYQVTDGAGKVEKSTTAAGACQNGHCSTSLDAGSGAAGTTKKFAVRAMRCAVSCSTQVTGAASPVSVSFAAGGHAVAPAPSPTATSPGHPTGHGDGVPSDPTGAAGAAPVGHAGHAARSARHHRAVRPLAGRSPAATSRPAPSSRPSSPSASSVAVAAHGGAGGLDVPPVLRALAIAAVVLLIAVHLRVWASSDFS